MTWMAKRLFFLGVLTALFFSLQVKAQSSLGFSLSDTVHVSLPDTTVECGDTVAIAINVDDVTGKEIYSFQFSLSYDSTVMVALECSTGSVTQAWGNPTCNLYTWPISIAMAGINPLSGSGSLVYIKFKIIGRGGDTTVIHFEQIEFNEGDPSADPQDGSLRVQPCTFQVDALPDTEQLCAGDTATFKVYVTSTSETCDSCQWVNLDIAYLPCGASFDFYADSLTPTDSSTLMIAVPDTCSAGTYYPIVIADNGTDADSVEVTVIISQPDFSLSVRPEADTICAGDSAVYRVVPTPIGECTDTVSLSLDTTGICAGSTWEFRPEKVLPPDSSTLVIYSGDIDQTAECNLIVSGNDQFNVRKDTATLVIQKRDFAIDVQPPGDTICVGDSAVFEVLLTEADCFDQECSLSVQILPDTGLTWRFDPEFLTPTDTSTLVIYSYEQNQTIECTLIVSGQNESLTHSDTVILLIQKGELAIQTSPVADSVCVGDSTIFKIIRAEAGCFVPLCSLYLEILPDDSGLTWIFVPDTLTPTDTSTLIVYADTLAPIRKDTLVITATGNGESYSDTVYLTTRDIPPPPVNVTTEIITSTDPNAIQICWDPVPEATHYYVYRDSIHSIGTAYDNCYSYSDPETDSHYYTASSVNECGESDQCEASAPCTLWEISGKVTYHDSSTPVEDFCVYVESDTGGLSSTGLQVIITDSTSTGDLGNYSFILPPGEYIVFPNPSYCDTSDTVDVYLHKDTSDVNLIAEPTAVEDEDDLQSPPSSFCLKQNYPNPFNPRTQIEFLLPKPCYVKLEIYNIQGKKVRTLLDTQMGSGYKILHWDGTDDKGKQVSSGVYFYKLSAGEYSFAKKMVILK